MVAQVGGKAASDFSLRFIELSSTRGIPCCEACHTLCLTPAAGKGRLRGERFPFTIFALYELGSCLQAGETNSARPGYYLWGARQGVAITRRGEDRGQSSGGDPFWKRDSVASRGGRPRKTADSGAVRLPAEKTPGKRRREDRGVSRGFCETWVDAEEREECGEEGEEEPSEEEISLA